MKWQSVALFAVAGLASLALSSSEASAKGGPYVDGATISGSGLSKPSSVSFSLPESYDDMYEAPAVPAQANGAMTAWYDITLHYDFQESGNGRRTWQGKFDGKDYLYFPVSMVVGPGIWSAGWYRANSLFAEELQRALAPSAPAVGSGAESDTTVDFDLALILGSLLVVAGLAGLAVQTRH